MEIGQSDSARKRLPNRRGCELFAFEAGGHRYTASFGRFDNGGVAEVFLDTGEPNTEIQTHATDSAVLVSLLLQHGVPLDVIAHSISRPIRTALDLLLADEGAR